MTIKVYLNPEKTTIQVINTGPTFNGNVKDLLSAINNGHNYGFEVAK